MRSYAPSKGLKPSWAIVPMHSHRSWSLDVLVGSLSGSIKSTLSPNTPQDVFFYTSHPTLAGGAIAHQSRSKNTAVSFNEQREIYRVLLLSVIRVPVPTLNLALLQEAEDKDCCNL